MLTVIIISKGFIGVMVMEEAHSVSSRTLPTVPGISFIYLFLTTGDIDLTREIN